MITLAVRCLGDFIFFALIATFTCASVLHPLLEELTSTLAAAFWSLVAVIALILSVVLRRVDIKNDISNRRDSIKFNLLIMTGMAVLVTLYIASAVGLAYMAHTPASSWDGLDFWLNNAAALFNEKLTIKSSSHPETLSLIFGLANSFGEQNSLISPLVLLNAAVTSGICAHVFSYTYGLTNRPVVALLVPMITASPLLLNHILLFGYTELYLTAIVVGMAFYLAAYRQRSQLVLITIVIGSGIAMVSLRNTGYLYFCIVIIAAFLCQVTEKPYNLGAKEKRHIQKPAVYTIAKIAASILIVSFAGFIVVHNFPLPLNEAVESRIIFAGRPMTPDLSRLPQIFQNIFQAWFLNASFSVFIFGVAIIIVSESSRVFFSRDILENEYAMRLPGMIAIVGVFGLTLAQLGDWAFHFARPERDTGLSRYSIPFLVLIPIAVVGTATKILKK